jgi:anion-transporting  ArsA/GET3 family ATPase
MDKRLVVVTGKGGVGKTTVAAALGLAAARRGKRVVLCEVAEQDRLAALFSARLTHAETELAPGLFAVSVDPERAKQEWLRYQLKSRRVAGVLGGSRLFQYLTAAAPGLSELVTIGKVWDLAQLERRTGGSVFDLAIVDAPATGHGLAMLRAPSTFAAVARVGPIGRQAERIDRSLRDPAHTGVVIAALPEEMPVNETVEFERALRRELDMAIDQIVVNAVHPARFSAAEARAVEDAQAQADAAWAGAAARAALGAALSEHRRARAENAQLRRLRRAASAPVTTLPRVFEPELRREDLERLSLELERRL